MSSPTAIYTLWPVCEEWLNDNSANWTAYYHGQATRFLTRYVKGSRLGAMPVRDIKVAHVYDLMQSIARRKALAPDGRKAEGTCARRALATASAGRLRNLPNKLCAQFGLMESFA
ncbi:phage integrase central domain-containing protein [Paraburkholderia podalyriae]|uniref:phage integrase central domain-containing protein n=1 Tax=Paraburkholderia TaxID=1822464 RepID=UPI0035E44D26